MAKRATTKFPSIPAMIKSGACYSFPTDDCAEVFIGLCETVFKCELLLSRSDNVVHNDTALSYVYRVVMDSLAILASQQ